MNSLGYGGANLSTWKVEAEGLAWVLGYRASSMPAWATGQHKSFPTNSLKLGHMNCTALKLGIPTEFVSAYL